MSKDSVYCNRCNDLGYISHWDIAGEHKTPCACEAGVTPKCPALGVGTVDKTDKEICDAATPGPWHEFEGGVATQNGTIVGRFAVRSAIYVDAVYAAHFNPAKVSKMLDALAAKDAEIERLRKQWECVPDEYENWSDFGQSLLDDNDQLTDQYLERGEEIERLKKLADRGCHSACLEHEILSISHHPDCVSRNLRDEITQLRTDLAEERRLNAEHEAHFVNTMNRHGVKEFRLDTNGWQDILRKKEQGK